MDLHIKSKKFFCIQLIILLVVFVSQQSCTNPSKNKTSTEILELTMQHYEGLEEIGYRLDYKVKHISSNDTFLLTGSAELERDETDTVFGGLFHFQTKEVAYAYDKNHLYVALKKDSTCTIYKGKDSSKSIVYGNLAYSMIHPYFFVPDKLRDQYRDTTTSATLINNGLDSSNYTVVLTQKPSTEEISARITTFLISTKDYSIKKITRLVSHTMGEQYEEWVFSDGESNMSTKELIDTEIEQLETNFKCTQGIYFSAPIPQMLAEMTAAPDFQYQTLNNETKSLSDLNGRVVILDFWYLGCQPCIQAIPDLIELQSKYKGNGVEIIGLNPFDFTEKQRPLLEQSVEKLGCNYPIATIPTTVLEAYKVKSYPTTYVIDKKGRIRFSSYGYYKDLTQDMDSCITSIFKEE